VCPVLTNRPAAPAPARQYSFQRPGGIPWGLECRELKRPLNPVRSRAKSIMAARRSPRTLRRAFPPAAFYAGSAHHKPNTRPPRPPTGLDGPAMPRKPATPSAPSSFRLARAGPGLLYVGRPPGGDAIVRHTDRPALRGSFQVPTCQRFRQDAPEGALERSRWFFAPQSERLDRAETGGRASKITWPGRADVLSIGPQDRVSSATGHQFFPGP